MRLKRINICIPPFISDPNAAGRLVQLTILTVLVAAVCAFVSPGHSDPPVNGDGEQGALWALSDEVLYRQVDKAIAWLTRHRPNHPVQCRPHWRAELAAYVVEAAHEYDLPPLLVTAVAYRESSFDPAAVGTDHPSKGLMQVWGVAAIGCDLSTPEGQLLCGSRWLRFCIDDCEGSIMGGLVSYGNGGECWAAYKLSSVRGAWRKMRLWGKLERLADGNR